MLYSIWLIIFFSRIQSLLDLTHLLPEDARSYISRYIYPSFCKKRIKIKSYKIMNFFWNGNFIKLKKIEFFISNKKIIRKEINWIKFLISNRRLMFILPFSLDYWAVLNLCWWQVEVCQLFWWWQTRQEECLNQNSREVLFIHYFL